MFLENKKKPLNFRERGSSKTRLQKIILLTSQKFKFSKGENPPCFFTAPFHNAQPCSMRRKRAPCVVDEWWDVWINEQTSDYNGIISGLCCLLIFLFAFACFCYRHLLKTFTVGNIENEDKCEYENSNHKGSQNIVNTLAFYLCFADTCACRHVYIHMYTMTQI